MQHLTQECKVHISVNFESQFYTQNVFSPAVMGETLSNLPSSSVLTCSCVANVTIQCSAWASYVEVTCYLLVSSCAQTLNFPDLLVEILALPTIIYAFRIQVVRRGQGIS